MGTGDRITGSESLLSAEYARGFDEGQEAIWRESVCSACGRNHDRDESAMCDGGQVVSFAEWVEAQRG